MSDQEIPAQSAFKNAPDIKLRDATDKARWAKNQMARISPKNIRFRPKEVICRDMSHVLRSSDLHIGTKLAVIDQIFWVWSEFDGKYAGCKYWSKAATESGLKNKGLVHEHLIPRKIVREMLMNLEDPSLEAVRDIFGRFCVGVVVTKEEDKRLNELGLNSKMPSDWDRKNLWARYHAAGIEVPNQTGEEAEQAGTGQPATRPVVEPEGSDKPQLDAEGRSR